MEKHNILIIDTSTSNLKITLSINGKDICIDEKNNLNHVERLIDRIDDCFKKIGEKKNNLEYIGICNGPGSFTGIRIGIATVLGISYSMNIISFGFSVFDIYRYLFKNEKDSIIIPVIDAKKNKFYCSFLSTNNRIEMYDLSFEELSNKISSIKKTIIFTGNDFKIIKDKINKSHKYLYDNDYSSNDMLSFGNYLINTKNNITPPDPVYLRKSEAEIALLSKNEKNKK